MITSRIKVNNLLYYFFALLIIYLPFQRFLEQILLNRGLSESLAFWGTRWYEPIIIIVLSIELIMILASGCSLCHPELVSGSQDAKMLKRVQHDKKNKSFIVTVSLLIFLSMISIIVLSPSISRGIEGFRFAIFFLLAFLAAYWSNFDQTRINKLTNIYLVIAGLFALWGILERFLPANYLATWGIIAIDSNFGYGTHKVVTVYQSVTGIGGPNQLASYLLPAVFIGLSQILNLKSQNYNSKLKIYLLILIIISIVAIILTFSRSAWVGLYVGLIISAILLIKNWWLKIASTILLLALAIGVGFYYLNKPNDILTHGASDTGHKSALNISLNEIQNRFSQPATLLLGSGIGTAGPAALKYGDGFISESWYLQLALELGFVGLVLWLVLIYYLLVRLYQKNRGLFLALLAVSATAIFLHTFADNPVMSMTLFILIGLGIQNEKNSD